MYYMDEKKKKDKFVIARIPAAIALAFRIKSEKGGRRVSEQLRELIDKFLKK